MDPDEIPGFTYSIGDPFTIGSVSGGHSTSINIPATNAARQALGGRGMTEIVGPEKLLRIGQGGHMYWIGRIFSAEASPDGYVLQSVNGNASWIEYLSSRRLSDIDFGDPGYVGPLTADFQHAVNADPYLPYCFPLIDYFGWSLNAHINTDVDELRPAIRIAHAVRHALSEIGWSMETVGGLTTQIDRYIMPFVGGDNNIVPPGSWIYDNRVVSIGGPVEIPASWAVFAALGNASFPVLPEPALTWEDPTGHIGVNNNSFVAPFACTVSITVQYTVTQSLLTINGGPNTFGLRYFIVGGTFEESNGIIAPMSTHGTIGDHTVTLPAVSLTTGQELRVHMFVNGYDTYPLYPDVILMTLDSSRVDFRIVDLPYAEDGEYELSSFAPDLTVMDALTGIVQARGLVFLSDDATRTVKVMDGRDFYKSIGSGISWLGKEDHTEPPVRTQAPRPSRVVMEFREDQNDVTLRRLAAGDPSGSYGGHIEEIGGDGKEVKVSSPFAATAMGAYEDGISIPRLRYEKEDGTPQTRLDWNPRILYWAGKAGVIPEPGGVPVDGWTHDGVDQEGWPLSYFNLAGREGTSIGFGPDPVSAVPGCVALFHSLTISRIRLGQSLVIYLRIGDDEVANIDFGQPVEVHDGEASHWYHIARIEQKRFGIDESTECELIPL